MLQNNITHFWIPHPRFIAWFTTKTHQPATVRPTNRRKWLTLVCWSWLMCLPLATAMAQDPIRIGWSAWSDAEFVTRLAARLIETQLQQPVELIQTDIAPQYQGLATGAIDAMLMSWQPQTHADYLQRLGDQIIVLGTLYTHARLGWAVPAYIPEEQLASILDLKKPAVQAQLKGRIVGIDAGAGLTRLSEQALQDYGLDHYHLQVSSGAGMSAALKRAWRRQKWIVVTVWSPHWLFDSYDLRYLEDPKHTLGKFERVVALARRGFYQDQPEVAGFLSRMQLPLAELEAAMSQAEDQSYEQAVTDYIKHHPQRIHYWLHNDFAAISQ
jgi:glycine betaine/proline transport system substrate-binding protein